MKRILPLLALLLFPSLAAFAQPEPERILYHLDKSKLPRKGRSAVVEIEVLRGGERFLLERHEISGRAVEASRIELAAQSPEVRRDLLALSRAEHRGNLVMVVRLDGQEIDRLPFQDAVDYDRLMRREASPPLASATAPLTTQECENQCHSNYNRCIFTTPSCQGMGYCPQCEEQLNRCIGSCNVPACSTDLCLTCGLPFTWTDDDGDTVPDRLEYQLAHHFFPNILLQYLDKDLAPSYLFRNWTLPFTVNPVRQGACDQDKECLEIRYGTAYTQDYGDPDLGGYSGHHGDGEFYAALVQRTTTWSTASTSVSYWQMVRDFTAAHWNTPGDSSRYGAYGNCPKSCSPYNNDEAGCTNSGWCSWQRELCYGTGDSQGLPCINHYWEEDCRASGCSWKPSACATPVRIACDATTPATSPRTFYAAEGKHGIYHTDAECESGGLFSADACPYNQYNLSSYKGTKLQNVGTELAHSDSVIYAPDGCYLYDVWSGNEFGRSHSNYRDAFRYPFNWLFPVPRFTLPTGPIF